MIYDIECIKCNKVKEVYMNSKQLDKFAHDNKHDKCSCGNDKYTLLVSSPAVHLGNGFTRRSF